MGAENAGVKMQFVKLTDQVARHENAGHEIAALQDIKLLHRLL